MKIIFLDVDGVLNSTRTAIAFGGFPMELHHKEAFDWVAIKLLQRLCDSSGAQVVLSSTWRLYFSVKEMADLLGLPIIDKTPMLSSPRGVEINDWLIRHPEVKHYAIVDDDSDMMPQQQTNFVQTNPEEGLSWANYRKICTLVGADHFEGEPRDREWRNKKTT